MLKGCWKRVESSLNGFKLSFNIDSTFPLFSKMLNGAEAVWTLSNNCRTHACSPQTAKVNIHYLRNPITHLYYPPKLLRNHCLQFLLGHESSSSKSNFAKVLVLLLAQCWRNVGAMFERPPHNYVFASNICPTSVQLLMNECWSNVKTV